MFILTLYTFFLAVVPRDANEHNTLRFAEHLIADKYGYAFGVAAADLDGDGDLDLTSGDIRRKPSLSTLYWFENNGQGVFRRHVIHKDEPGWFERHSIGDINGDGRPDVAIVDYKDGHLLWFANLGKSAAKPWKRYVITTKCTRAYDVALADLDGDGDLDAAAAGYASGLFTWYENPGESGWQREWTGRRIGDKMPEARTVRIGDFNRDGHPDVLAACVGVENVAADVTDVKLHGSSVVWYENPGRPAEGAWRNHVIDDKSRAQIHGHPIDLDGDGDLDIVMALGMRDALVPHKRHHVAWYENLGAPGDGLRWKKHKIGDLPYAFEACAADLDGDGDVDVAATAWAKGDRVVWFENLGDGRGVWKLHVIKENWGAANQLIVADFNGDRKLDIAATADNGSRYATGALELRWWRNK